MNILITGGAGFIGSQLIDSCIKRDDDVTVIDDLFKGSSEIMASRAIKFYKVSITNRSQVEFIVRKTQPEVVVHLAALHYIPECNKNPRKTLEINACGTKNILRSCSTLKDLPYFIFASSASVYQPSLKPLEEKSPLNPTDIYGKTKLVGENMVIESPLPFSILRIFNVFGQNDTNPHLIPCIIRQLDSREIKLGNVSSKRDFVYISDVVKAIEKTANLRPENEIINIGTNKVYSAEDLIFIISNILGKKLEITQVESKKRKGDNPYLCADINKAYNILKWSPQVNMMAGLRKLLL